MPVEFPAFSSDGDPRNTLVLFVRAVHDFLGEIVESNHDRFTRPLFWEELLPPMRGAWREVEEHRHFPEVESRIQRLTEAQFRDHGLYGQQLAFKLAVIRFFYGRYLSFGKGILKKLLDIIDDLLKSILDAIGSGGAISEIKDFIRDSIQDETESP